MSTAPDPLPPDELGRRLSEVFLLVGPLYRKVFRVVEDNERQSGVSVGVRAVLDLLRTAGPMTVPQMAREQALSRQFVQRMVNDAVEQGWARLRPNPAHRRSSLVELTATGRRVITAVADAEVRSLSAVGGDLTRSDVDTTLRVLTRLLDMFDTVDVDR